MPLELYGNKNFFQNFRPIVPRRQENLLPEVQETVRTSDVSKLLGQVIRKIPNGDKFSSPIQIDYAIKAWTGGLGKYGLEALDFILKKSGVTQEE